MAHPPLFGHHLLRRLPPPPEQIPGATATLPYSSPYYDHRNTSDLNSKIMLTAIISLSVVVFVVTALHIYARILLRRQSRQRAVLRLAADFHSVDPPSSGLAPSVIASLPIFVYKTTTSDGASGDGGEAAAGLECAVCLSGLEDEEMARSLPNCKHVFHAECIDKWLSSHSNCPICRTEAEPRILPVAREGPASGSWPCAEGSSSQKGGNSGSGSRRLSSFRRMLSRERSSRRIQAEIIEDCLQDLERQ